MTYLEGRVLRRQKTNEEERLKIVATILFSANAILSSTIIPYYIVLNTALTALILSCMLYALCLFFFYFCCLLFTRLGSSVSLSLSSVCVSSL